ncbi:MAG: PQQ-binding-like beta-propeller repeat protein [Acidobacteriota bacterium]
MTNSSWRHTAILSPFLLFSLLARPDAAAALDWPQYRGLRGDGISTETGLLDTWPEDGPPRLWTVPIGEAYSSVSVRGDVLCTQDADDASEYVLCARLTDGATLWRSDLDNLFHHPHGNGSRATPTLTARRIFAISGAGRLAAFDLEGGQRLWSTSLPETLGESESLLFGYSMSPLVLDDLVIVAAGGTEDRFVGAFDAATGALRWTAGQGEPTYSTPLNVQVGDHQQVIVQSATEILAVSPTGDALWSWPWEGRPVKAAMPVLIPPDGVFVSMSYDIGGLALQLPTGKKPARVAWQGRAMRNHFNSSLHLDGQLYGFDNAIFKCLDAATGELRWRQSRLGGKGSLIAADGKLIVLNERGFLRLVDADPQAYVEISGFQALNGRSWSAPVLAHGRLLLRDQDEMTAFDLRRPGAAQAGATEAMEASR